MRKLLTRGLLRVLRDTSRHRRAERSLVPVVIRTKESVFSSSSSSSSTKLTTPFGDGPARDSAISIRTLTTAVSADAQTCTYCTLLFCFFSSRLRF